MCLPSRAQKTKLLLTFLAGAVFALFLTESKDPPSAPQVRAVVPVTLSKTDRPAPASLARVNPTLRQDPVAAPGLVTSTGGRYDQTLMLVWPEAR